MAEAPNLPIHIYARVFLVRTGGVIASCGFYFSAPVYPGGVEDMTNVADSIFAAWDGPWAATLPTSASFHSVLARVVGGSQDWEAGSTDSPVAGSVVSEPHPEEVAAVIQRRTGLAGRHKRGRIFLPFVPETFTADSTLTTGPALGVSRYTDLAGILGDPIQVGNGGPIITSVQPDRKLGMLHPVAEWRVATEVMSRRDRRAPKRSAYISAWS